MCYVFLLSVLSMPSAGDDVTASLFRCGSMYFGLFICVLMHVSLQFGIKLLSWMPSTADSGFKVEEEFFLHNMRRAFFSDQKIRASSRSEQS